MNFLDKLRRQPVRVRKLILWLIMIVVGLVLAVWWIHNSYQGMKNLQPKEVIEEQWIKNIEQQLK